MEIGERAPKKGNRRKLGKSTGEPIEDDDCIKQHQDRNNNNSCRSERKLASISEKLFFIKSSKSLTAKIHRQKKVSSTDESTVASAAGVEGTADHSSGSSDEWHLLEPDEEEDQDQNLKFAPAVQAAEGHICNGRMPPNNNSNNNNNNNNSYNNKVKHSEQKARQYVDIDPRESSNASKPSPASVHLCTALYAMVPLASLCAFVGLISLALFTRFWPLSLVYFVYLLLDRQTCNRGGRRLEFIYRAKFWSLLAAYFPIRLRYSNHFQLDSKQNYILNYHPHGIAAFGCVSTFATNGLNFSNLFPGIRSRFLVHETSFCVPLMREIFIFRGDCSVNSRSIDYLLEKKWRQPNDKGATGNLLAICGGGLAEADLSNAKVLKVVVNNRKGFVKKALIHGAHLIPCIAFGENSVFTKIDFAPSSLMHRLEAQWYQMMKFKHPFYYGRSILGGSKLKGAMPYKRPITVAMGDPIKVERVAEPTQQQVDETHARYLEGLAQLYRDNSDLCSEFDLQLQLV